MKCECCATDKIKQISEGPCNSKYVLLCDYEFVDIAPSVYTFSKKTLLKTGRYIKDISLLVVNEILAATIDCGDSVVLNKFASGLGTTADTSVSMWKSTAPFIQSFDSKIQFTPNTVPLNSDGKILVVVWYEESIPPSL